MEISLIEKPNSVKTRFKLTLEEFKNFNPLLIKMGIDTGNPVKEKFQIYLL